LSWSERPVWSSAACGRAPRIEPVRLGLGVVHHPGAGRRVEEFIRDLDCRGHITRIRPDPRYQIGRTEQDQSADSKCMQCEVVQSARIAAIDVYAHKRPHCPKAPISGADYAALRTGSLRLSCAADGGYLAAKTESSPANLVYRKTHITIGGALGHSNPIFQPGLLTS
jgi:hypothetical protein